MYWYGFINVFNSTILTSMDQLHAGCIHFAIAITAAD